MSLVTWVCLLKYYSPVVPTSTTQLSLLCNWNTLDKSFSSGRFGKSLLTVKVLPLRQFELFPAFYKPTNINSKYISDLFPIIQWANEISHGPTSWYGWLDNDEKQAKISSPFQGFLCKPTWDLTLISSLSSGHNWFFHVSNIVSFFIVLNLNISHNFPTRLLLWFLFTSGMSVISNFSSIECPLICIVRRSLQEWESSAVRGLWPAVYNTRPTTLFWSAVKTRCRC